MSNHARERIETYGLNEEFVLETVKNPERVVDGYDGRIIAQRTLNHYILRVIYEEHGNEKLIITVYPAEKKRYWREKNDK